MPPLAYAVFFVLSGCPASGQNTNAQLEQPPISGLIDVSLTSARPRAELNDINSDTIDGPPPSNPAVARAHQGQGQGSSLGQLLNQSWTTFGGLETRVAGGPEPLVSPLGRVTLGGGALLDQGSDLAPEEHVYSQGVGSFVRGVGLDRSRGKETQEGGSPEVWTFNEDIFRSLIHLDGLHADMITPASHELGHSWLDRLNTPVQSAHFADSAQPGSPLWPMTSILPSENASAAPAYRLSAEDAAAILRAAKEQEPVIGADPRAQTLLGQMYQLGGDDGSAYLHFERAMAQGQRDVPTLTGYAVSASRLGAAEAAQRAASLVLEQDPLNPVASSVLKLSRGRASSAGVPSSPLPEQARGADTAGQVPVAASFKAVQALLHLAAEKIGMREYASARVFADRAINLDPGRAPAYELRAQAELGLRDYAQGLRDTELALALAPRSLPALLNRAWALIRLARYAAAVKAADAVVRVRPDIFHGYWLKAYALAGLRDRRGMRAALARAARINPALVDLYARAVHLPEGDDLLGLFQSEAPAAAGGRARRRAFPPAFALFLGLCALSAVWRVRSLAMEGASLSVLGREGLGLEPVCATASRAIWSQYRLVRELGKGGMGIVYEAVDERLARRVAIKRLRDELRMEARQKHRLLDEARLVAKLRHPGIVEVYSIREDDQDLYLVFEYVSGKTVSQLLGERGRLTWPDAMDILREACGAVEYAHSRGVIHRDIKPSNIMIGEGSVKVMDFGIARQAQREDMPTVSGTPAYMAPEQARGVSRQESDVYALGVCFYEMLSGELPFLGQGAGVLLNKLSGSHVPLSRRVQSGVPARVDAVVDKVLAPDPDRRFHTPAEFLSALEALGAPCPA